MKAIAGVVVLLVVGGVASVMGVRVVQNMINANGESRLARFSDGTDNPIVATIGDPSARITLDLPSTPQPGHESMTFLTSVRQVDRVISPAGSDGAVQVLWFNVAPGMASNPETALKLLAGAETATLGGTEPIGGHMVSSGTVAMYDFSVHPVGSAAGGADYFVRILLRGDLVYVVRVEADSGGPKALTKVVGSIQWVVSGKS